jgi:hypothetical protein
MNEFGWSPPYQDKRSGRAHLGRQKNVKNSPGVRITLKSCADRNESVFVIRFLQQLLHRPALKLGSLGLIPQSRSRLRNERFASYLVENNRKAINTDMHDALLAWRRLARHAFIFAAVGMIVWVVFESAQAVGVF